MKKFRQFFQEKILLSAVMCVLLAVVLVSATYGWYAVKNSLQVYNIKLQAGGTDETGEIKVAIEHDGEDIMTPNLFKMTTVDGKEYAQIKFPYKLNNFENIQEQMIAPGAYNPMTFYITSLATNVKSYSIKVQLVYEPSDKSSKEQKQKIEEIEAIIRDHITVYQEMKPEDSNGIVSFDKPLTYDKEVTREGELIYKEEVPVTIYWVWNYEATDVPGGYKAIQRFAKLDESSAIRKYDEEDTTIGNYIDGIYFNVVIEGKVSR